MHHTTEFRQGYEIRVEPDFDFRSKEYRELFEASAATAFQAPLWMDTLHRRLGPSLGARQHTVTVRERRTDGLMAVIPLVIQKSLAISMAMPADFGLCDYNAVVASAENLEVMAADDAIKSGIASAVSSANLLIFRKMRADGFDVARLFRSPRVTDNENDAHHCELDDDFENWRRKTLRKKFTKERERQQRQMEREIGPFEHRVARDADEIRAAFAFAMRARAGRFEDDLFSREPYHSAYLDYAIAAAESGEAITYVSVLDGEVVAMLFGLAGDGAFHAVIIAADTERYEKQSIGLQILYRVIKKRFDEGHRIFDMGLGDTGYKSHFRAETTVMRNCTVSQSLAGSLVAAVYNHAKPVKNRLRRLAPRLR